MTTDPLDQAPVEPGTPVTEAGRRLAATWANLPDGPMVRGILAIEAEARASLLAAVREGVEGQASWKRRPFGAAYVNRRAVLDLLDTLSDEPVS